MSEFKLRPTPTLMRLLVEQLQANGLDISQEALPLDTSVLGWGEYRSTEVRQHDVTSFLAAMHMPLDAAWPFGSTDKGIRTVFQFLKDEGFITEVDGKLSLNLRAMNDVAIGGQMRPTLAQRAAASRPAGGRGAA